MGPRSGTSKNRKKCVETERGKIAIYRLCDVDVVRFMEHVSKTEAFELKDDFALCQNQLQT